MPLAGDFYDHAGVSRSARDEFYRKLPALVEQYHFPVVEFQEHDETRLFFTFTKVTSLPKAGCITIARSTISFTTVCHYANK